MDEEVAVSTVLEAIDQSPGGVVVTGPASENAPIRYVNDGFCRLTGYDPEEVIGRNCRFLQGPETGETARRELRAAVERGRPVATEILNYRKDGTPFWNRVSLIPLSGNGEGSPTHFFGFQRDVTSEVEYRTEVIEQERLLSYTEQVAGVGGWRFDVPTQAVTVTPGARPLFGLTDDGPAPWAAVVERLAAPDRERLQRAGERAVEEGVAFDLVVSAPEAADDTKWLRVAGYPEADEPVAGIRGIVQDITEQRLREEELLLFKQAVEHAGNAIYITEPDATIRYVNPAFESVTGYAAEEAVGKSTRILQSALHDEEYYTRLWQTIRSGSAWRGEITDRRRSGEFYIADQTIAPLPDERGYVAVQTDVTDDRIHQQERHVLQRILRHNLRNELNVVRGLADIEADDPAPDNCEGIVAASDRLLALSRTIQRLEAHLDRDHLRDTAPVGSVVDEVVAWSAERFPELAVCRTVETDARVSGAGTLAYVLRELIENAAEHTTRGDPTVDLHVRTVETPPGSVEVVVSDNGPGLPTNELVAFSSGVETPLEHGVGLGLWAVTWLTRKIGGVATADADDDGTTVRLLLPTLDG